MLDWTAVNAALADAGHDVRPGASPRPVGGGDISAGWRLETSGGAVFAKTGPASSFAMFSAEAEGLEALAGPGRVPGQPAQPESSAPVRGRSADLTGTPQSRQSRGWLQPRTALAGAAVLILIAIASFFFIRDDALPTSKHIAVLPFVNIGDESNQSFGCSTRSIIGGAQILEFLGNIDDERDLQTGVVGDPLVPRHPATVICIVKNYRVLKQTGHFQFLQSFPGASVSIGHRIVVLGPILPGLRRVRMVGGDSDAGRVMNRFVRPGPQFALVTEVRVKNRKERLSVGSLVPMGVS